MLRANTFGPSQSIKLLKVRRANRVLVMLTNRDPSGGEESMKARNRASRYTYLHVREPDIASASPYFQYVVLLLVYPLGQNACGAHAGCCDLQAPTSALHYFSSSFPLPEA